MTPFLHLDMASFNPSIVHIQLQHQQTIPNLETSTLLCTISHKSKGHLGSSDGLTPGSCQLEGPLDAGWSRMALAWMTWLFSAQYLIPQQASLLCVYNSIKVPEGKTEICKAS